MNDFTYRKKYFRIKINTVRMWTVAAEQKTPIIPERCVHFVDVECMVTISNLIECIRKRYNLHDLHLEFSLDGYILHGEDPVQVLKDDDCVTLCLRKYEDDGSNSHVSRTETPNEVVSVSDVEGSQKASEANNKEKKKKKRHQQENCEAENGVKEICEIVCSDVEPVSSQQHKKKKKKRQESEIDGEEICSEDKRRKKRRHSSKHEDSRAFDEADNVKKQKRSCRFEDKTEDRYVSDDEVRKKQKRREKRREVVAKVYEKKENSVAEEKQNVTFSDGTENYTIPVENQQCSSEALDTREARIPCNSHKSVESMWDVRETYDMSNQSAEPKFPSSSKSNLFNGSALTNTSIEDSEQNFAEKKKRRRRRKRKQDNTPSESVANQKTTVYLRNPTLFVPPAQKSGRKKWANGTTNHIHFDEEEDQEPNTDSSDRGTGQMNISSDLNISDMSLKKFKTSSTPLDEDKGSKKGLLSMVPRSVTIFKKQPEENVRLEPSPTYCRPMPPQFSSPYSQKSQNDGKDAEVESPLLNLVGMGNVSFQRKMKRNHLKEKQVNVSTIYTSPQAAVPELSTGNEPVSEEYDVESQEVDRQVIPVKDESSEKSSSLDKDEYTKFRENIYADMSFQSPANARNTKFSHDEQMKKRYEDETMNSGHEDAEMDNRCEAQDSSESQKKENNDENGEKENTEPTKQLMEKEEVLPSHVLPNKGWFLSFKMLELSSFGCPEISDVKLAEVIDVDVVTKSVTLQCIRKFAQRSKGSLLCVEGSDPSMDDSRITMNWTDVIEPRQLLPAD